MSDMKHLAILIKDLEDQLVVCMRCGMCQAVCPVFAETGREADVARGKLALLDGLVQEMFKDPKGVNDRLMRCLLCGTENPPDEAQCRRCEHKLLVLHSDGREGGEEFLGPAEAGLSLDEHLLERVSLLEEAVKRTAEAVGRLATVVTRLEQGLAAQAVTGEATRELLLAKGVAQAADWQAACERSAGRNGPPCSDTGSRHSLTPSTIQALSWSGCSAASDATTSSGTNRALFHRTLAEGAGGQSVRGGTTNCKSPRNGKQELKRTAGPAVSPTSAASQSSSRPSRAIACVTAENSESL